GRLRIGGSATGALAVAILFVLAFAVLPVALLFGGAVVSEGGGGVLSVAADPLTHAAIDNSIVQGVASAALAAVFGYPLGVVLGRWRWPGQGAVRAMLLVPFLLPTVVVVLGFDQTVGPGGWLSGGFVGRLGIGQGLPALIVLNATLNVSIVALAVSASVEAAPVEQEEAVRTLGGSPWRAFREVWGPPSFLALGGGSLLTFLLSALGFAPPILLCGPSCFTVEDRVYTLAETLGQPGAAAVLGLLGFGLLVGPALAYLLLAARRRSVTRRSRPPTPLPWRRPFVWPLLAAAAIPVAAILVLLGTIVVSSIVPRPGAVPGAALAALFGPLTTTRLGLSTVAVLGNSVLFTAIAATGSLLLGLAIGFAARRRPSGHWKETLPFLVPLLVSPILLAFSLATFWRPALGGADSVWILIILSQIVITMPFVVPTLILSLGRVPRAFGEAARSLGARPGFAFFDAELPLARPALLTAVAFAAALGFGEFTATYFLYIPRFTTLPVELFVLLSSRQLGAAAALGGVFVVVSFALLAVLELGGRRVDF
ncbi:MAG: ABC transporter permease subunit, partial [Thermoplasmata archaeon]|nr:ABC transporter permease subunit [Thermoplasmata archaeon]